MTRQVLYKVWCVAEQRYRRVTSESEPQQCPVPHADRTIDPNLTEIIDWQTYGGNQVEILTPKLSTVTSKQFQDLKTNFYFDATVMRTLRAVRLMGFLDKKLIGKEGDYDFRVYDATHQRELGRITASNTTLESVAIEELVNAPQTSAIIEFHARINSGGDRLEIGSLAVYYEARG